jgi:hypothetical protein
VENISNMDVMQLYSIMKQLQVPALTLAAQATPPAAPHPRAVALA